MNVTPNTVDRKTKLAMVAQLIKLGCASDPLKDGWESVKSSKGKTVFKSNYIGNGYYMVKYPTELFDVS